MNKRSNCITLLIVSALALTHLSTERAAAQVSPLHQPVALHNPVQDKNFYLLSLLEQDPSIANLLAKDPELSRMTGKKLKDESSCNAAPACIVDAAFWTPREISLVSERLTDISRSHPEIDTTIITPMRQSGFYELYEAEKDIPLLTRAWSDAAEGMNGILRTYGKAQPPRYPRIDSSSFDLKSPAGRQMLHDFSNTMAEVRTNDGATHHELFFQPSLQLAMLLLKANHRDEAGRFEPLASGENAATLAHLSAIRWTRYPYTVIVVPGLGPEQPGVALDPGGRARVALAVKNYHAGLAPIILVSGGFVHPAQTRFCEAIEMKKALISEFGIPANVILVDPHARHTTTNIRNATRLIYRYRIPFDRPALITTDPSQSSYITSSVFTARSEDELGYLPFRQVKRISRFDIAFYPEIDDLQENSADPLDP